MKDVIRIVFVIVALKIIHAAIIVPVLSAFDGANRTLTTALSTR